MLYLIRIFIWSRQNTKPNPKKRQKIQNKCVVKHRFCAQIMNFRLCVFVFSILIVILRQKQNRFLPKRKTERKQYLINHWLKSNIQKTIRISIKWKNDWNWEQTRKNFEYIRDCFLVGLHTIKILEPIHHYFYIKTIISYISSENKTLSKNIFGENVLKIERFGKNAKQKTKTKEVLQKSNL